ncbi:MAG TPA: ATP-binding protein, partial [Caulobacterales bacterium]|nr:ATP-binding protein [Caulobacterales bacterium]
FLKDDPAKLLKRDRKGFGPLRANITLRARDGMETPAVALTAWPASDSDGASRTVVFFHGQDAPSGETAAPARAPAGPIDGFFENAPLGAALLDSADLAQGVILESNPALMDMAQGRAAPGARFADLFDGSDGPAELARRLRGASPSQHVELTLATSPPRAVHIHFARGPDGKGLAFVTNVAEQREIEQRLAQSEKTREIGVLAAGVAHDFNNTLTVVMHSTEYLLSRHPVGDPDFEDLNKINTYTLRSRELTEMLLAVARQKTFKREIVDVSGMIVQVHELTRRVVGDKIDFKVVHARDLPLIKVDKSELERVIVNLVTNARDAINAKDGGRGGVLTLRTLTANAQDAHALGHHSVEAGDYVVIEVADTGTGIRPEDQGKIFKNFFSTKEPGKGTGLGLTTSFNIVKQLGGFIFFDTAVGKGTTFRIYMPAYEPTAEELEEMARRDRERLAGRGKDLAARGKILLVEDEDGVRRALARTLKGFGCEIVEAENGEDALDVLAANPGAFDLIISDVSMPLMTGPEMLRAMPAEALGKAKVLFLSGYAPESFAKMLEEYPVSFLSKPVGAAELAAKVRELLGL